MLAFFCRSRGRQQDGVMPDAVAFAGLAQAQAAVEHGIVGDRSVTHFED